MFGLMWKALVNIVRRCLRTAFGTPGAKRETRVQNPPQEMSQDQALAYAHKLMTEFLDLYHQWKAGTLPAHMLRQPTKPRRRSVRKRVIARPASVRRKPRYAAPQRGREQARAAPIPPGYLHPHALDGPKIFFPRCATLSPITPDFITNSN
jgi:hypothetical protein